MKFKSMIAVLAISMAVLMTACGTGADSSSAPEATPVASATPAPTETPAPTDEPGTLEFDFDISVETYKVTQGVTEEELLADQTKKEGMFEWFYDGAVNYAQALMDRDAGCENVFLDEYLQWAGDKAKAEMGETGETTQPETGTDNTSDEDWVTLPDGSTQYVGDLSDIGMYDQSEEEAAKWKENAEALDKEAADLITSGEVDKMLQEVRDKLAQNGYQP